MSDRIFGIAAALAGVAYLFLASRIQVGFLVDPVGPKTFPMIIGGIGALCGVLIALAPDRPGPSWPGLRTLGALLVALVVLVAYAYTLKPLGFLLPTAVAAGVLSWLIHPRASAAVVTGLGLSIGLFALFRLLDFPLKPLPKGVVLPFLS